MTDNGSLETAQAFAQIGRDLLAADGVDETLDVLVHLATVTIDGCDHAAVSLIVAEGIHSRASTGDVPRRVDAIQYETGQGPCLDAIRDHEVFQTDDLVRELRWPEFASRAANETGVHSMLAFRLFAGTKTMGALNLYSEEVAAFDAMGEAVGVVLAAHAAIALSAAQDEENFERAVESRDIIGEAKGILIERRGVTAREAFNILRRSSQGRNQKLRHVATELVETGLDPERT